jgi:uncharacterized protein YecE (DUF72 family)
VRPAESDSLAMTVRIGISGWRYEPWRGIFYPPGLAQRRELEYASRAFASIEINGSFYSLQTPRSYACWRDATPAGFMFSLKGPRYLTHILRLKNIERPMANFFASGVFELGAKLGPILWQFPPSLRYDPKVFGDFLRLLPRDTAAAQRLARRRDAHVRGRTRLAIDAVRPLRHAVEIRHETFASAEFIAQLREHSVALVVADTAGKWPLLEDITADFVYLRLHGDRELYASGYTDRALGHWADRISAWHAGREPRDVRRVAAPLRNGARRRDVFCYFDNDVKVRAPFDADRLMSKLALARTDENFVFPSRSVLKNIRPVTPLPRLRWRPALKSTKTPGTLPRSR